MGSINVNGPGLRPMHPTGLEGRDGGDGETRLLRRLRLLQARLRLRDEEEEGRVCFDAAACVWQGKGREGCLLVATVTNNIAASTTIPSLASPAVVEYYHEFRSKFFPEMARCDDIYCSMTSQQARLLQGISSIEKI
ncbi:hypothetical protein E2562_033846 [Oryza meyeriana var. granulata]|uniref:Uncharacterized protein n=1 Tax=Oryza meyeriana var. granulata TaxID=110450 RepID=A0A6G1BPJ7_9ORYZ|nr:hypothetical protein E2562_033846 [Oryza meyeriana var. granulata]